MKREEDRSRGADIDSELDESGGGMVYDDNNRLLNLDVDTGGLFKIVQFGMDGFPVHLGER